MPHPYLSLRSKSYKIQAGSFVQVAAPSVPLNKPLYVIRPIWVVVSTVALWGICTLIPRIKNFLVGILPKFLASSSIKLIALFGYLNFSSTIVVKVFQFIVFCLFALVSSALNLVTRISTGKDPLKPIV